MNRSEILIGALVFVGLMLLMMETDAFEAVYDFTRKHESWALDELILAALSLLIGGLIALVVAARRRARELAHTSDIRSLFLSNMNHELRTPLNAIMGFSDVMRRLPADKLNHENVTAYSALIHESGESMLQLVENVLDLDAYGEGHRTIRAEEIDAAELLAACAQELRGIAQARGVEIIIDVDTDLPPFAADLRLVNRMLLNLLDNAVKFSPTPGAVRLRAFAPRGRPTLQVIDQGPGIDADLLPDIFEPFARMHESHMVTQANSGLGLPVVNCLIMAHGGNATIQSTKGVGTTVTLTFPAMTPPPPTDKIVSPEMRPSENQA